MKILIFMCILLSMPAHASEKILYISSDLKSEAASEEAVLLIQCLTGVGQYSWEMKSQTSQIPRLVLQEKEKEQMEFILTTAKQEIKKTVAQGELLTHCESLRKALDPELSKMADLAPVAHDAAPIPDYTEEKNEKPKILPWVIGGGLAAIGVFFFWKSRQPNFTRIESGAH